MRVGKASGLPVVPAVATADRWNHVVRCPYCASLHVHGGYGPTSPVGAINGGRVSHCIDREARAWYVLMELPGTASAGNSPALLLAPRAAAAARVLLPAVVAEYESRFRGPGDVQGRRSPDNLALIRGEVPWPSAFYGNGPVVPGSQRWPRPTAPQTLYRFFTEPGALLYIGITGDASTRWKAHSREKAWWLEVSYIRVEHYETREAVEAAEKAAIVAERPAWNVTHNREGRRHSSGGGSTGEPSARPAGAVGFIALTGRSAT